MNNFPENENKGLETREELSTVFSNPNEHKAVNIKNGNKKRLKIVLIALLAVAVLVSGTFVTIKFIPEKIEESNTPKIETIEVLKANVDEYKTVSIKNKNGTFDFYSVTTKSEVEDAADVVEWYMDGYDAGVVDTNSISTVISSLGSITASREITAKSLADCGLEKPQIEAKITTEDGGEYSILIGDKSPDNSGIYLKLSTKDNIYLVTSDLDTTLTFEALNFADKSNFSGMTLSSDYSDYTDDNKLTGFDSISIKSKNFKDTLVIEPNNDETTNSFMRYLVTSPQNRTADYVDELLAIFADGITVSGAYSFDVKPATLSKLGLNNPDFVITVKVKDVAFTYKFKQQLDGSYAVINDDSLLVKKIDANTLSFLNNEQTDFYIDWVFIESIDNISNLTIKSDNKTYSIDVSRNPDEEDEENKYIVDYEGKSLTSENFQDFYRFCITLTCSDYNVEDITSPVEASITYNYKDYKSKPVTLEFRKASATKYQYSLNGKAMGKINASEFRKLSKYLKQLVQGETVTFN